MKKIISVKHTRDVLILAENITYNRIGDWYDCTWVDMKMDIICPKQRANHALQPCLIWLCGGGFVTERKDIWAPEMMYYAERGITVALVDYRTTNKGSFPAQLIDVKAAIRYLRAHAADFCIDPDRIFTMGESAGGTLSTLVGVTSGVAEYDQGEWLEYSSAVTAAIDIYGSSGFRNRLRKNPDGTTSLRPSGFLGSNPEETVEKATALNYVNEHTCPFLILHGGEDELVPLQESEALYEKLCECGVEAEYYIIEGAKHGDELIYQDDVKALAADFILRH